MENGKWADVLPVIRPLQPTLIGSAAYSATPTDIDILIAAPLAMIPAVVDSLLALGFTRNTPDPVTTDDLVHSSYSRGRIDIQISTPENYSRKRAVNKLINRLCLHAGRNKAQRYILYRELYKLMQM